MMSKESKRNWIIFIGVIGITSTVIGAALMCSNIFVARVVRDLENTVAITTAALTNTVHDKNRWKSYQKYNHSYGLSFRYPSNKISIFDELDGEVEGFIPKPDGIDCFRVIMEHHNSPLYRNIEYYFMEDLKKRSYEEYADEFDSFLVNATYGSIIYPGFNEEALVVKGIVKENEEDEYMMKIILTSNAHVTLLYIPPTEVNCPFNNEIADSLKLQPIKH